MGSKIYKLQVPVSARPNEGRRCMYKTEIEEQIRRMGRKGFTQEGRRKEENGDVNVRGRDRKEGNEEDNIEGREKWRIRKE